MEYKISIIILLLSFQLSGQTVIGSSSQNIRLVTSQNDTVRGITEMEGKVSSIQLGMIPNDPSAAVSNREVFMNAALNIPTNGYEEIYIRKGLYYMDSSITLPYFVKIRGGGSGDFQSPAFVFPRGYRGLDNYSGAKIDIKGVRFTTWNRGDTANYAQSTGHGIGQSQWYRLEDVVIDGFTGEGFNGSSNSSGGSNANLFAVINCIFRNNGSHGIRIGREDANAGYTLGVVSINNGGDGIRDASFLGNAHIAPKSNGNTGYNFNVTDINARVNIVAPIFRDYGAKTSYTGFVTILNGVHNSTTSGAAYINYTTWNE